MKLSIITVNLNNRDGLQKTIDSVVAQTFKDFEWIVIDGGSTDGSKELIERYSDHFAYWVSEPDKGIYNAMNKGIKVAQGEYLQFLNSGDWLWNKDILQEVLFDDSKNEVDILYGKSLVHDVNGEVFEYGPHYNTFTPFSLIYSTISHPATFTRRELFEKYGFFDESFRIAGDLEFFFRAIILNHATTKYINRTITHFAGGGLSMTSPEQTEKEKHLIIDKYMLSGSSADYNHYVSLLKYENLFQEKKRAISVYDSLHQHWFSRKAMHLLYRIFK